jgi:Na+-driven multidrug efflux pump
MAPAIPGHPPKLIFYILVIPDPFAYLMAKYFEMGPTGVFVTIPISEIGLTIAAYILFKRGKWKKTMV